MPRNDYPKSIAGITLDDWRTIDSLCTFEGESIRFYSKAQLFTYLMAVGCRQPYLDLWVAKAIRQSPSGDILIHTFMKIDGRWHGTAKFIGPRGGSPESVIGEVYQAKTTEESRHSEIGDLLQLFI